MHLISEKTFFKQNQLAAKKRQQVAKNGPITCTVFHVHTVTKTDIL